ncbi:MAG: 6-phosphogluconolactonase [Chloroflexi bacterium]|nr:6-phosphogluconolactonase [Chloroflexota bacterium]
MAEVVRLDNAEAVAQETARRWVMLANQAVAERGMFTIALSGGSTPRTVYSMMAADPWRGQAPWQDTYVFFGDERRVHHSDPESNYRMARETLLDHVPIPPNQVFPMPGEGLLKTAMLDYKKELRKVFKPGFKEFPRFDFVLLGMGEDAHIASIFPGTRAVSEGSEMVLAYLVPQMNVERMTLTLPVINNALQIVVQVVGQHKADALAKVLEGDYRPSTYPAQALEPVDGQLIWLVDQAAASKLTR